MRTLLKLVFALLVVSAWAEDAAPQAAVDFSSLEAQAKVLIANDDAQTKTLGAIQKNTEDISKSLADIGKSNGDALKAQTSTLQTLSEGQRDIISKLSQAPAAAAAAPAAESNSEVLAAVAGVQTQTGAIQTSLNTAAESLTKLDAKLSGSVSDITAAGKDAATAASGVAELKQQLQALSQEVRELKSLVQTVVSNLGASEQARGLLDRLSVAQERILERLDGGVLDTVGKVLGQLQAFAASYFDRLTVLGKSLLGEAKNCLSSDIINKVSVEVQKVVSNSDVYLAQAQAKATALFQQGQVMLFQLQRQGQTLLAQQGLDSEVAFWGSWSVLGLAGSLALLLVLLVLPRLLSFLICSLLCCGRCRKSSGAAKKKANKPKKGNK